MITNLLTSDDINSLADAMLEKQRAAIGKDTSPVQVWSEALELLRDAQAASYKRRCKSVGIRVKKAPSRQAPR